MKKQLAILLLVCYAFALFKPVAPVIADMLAHTFWESNHVATVHYENGGYHMHIEVKDANADAEKTNSKDSKLQNNKVSVHLLSDSSFFGEELNHNFRLVDHNHCAVSCGGYGLIPFSPPRSLMC
ncbi:MAG TPA: hypothetical protein VK826_18200 [Bacteroidia bacterium]|nr:hypothetical protein [Bacteroidia bacterium]